MFILSLSLRLFYLDLLMKPFYSALKHLYIQYRSYIHVDYYYICKSRENEIS